MPDCVMRQEMIKAKFSKGKTKMQVHTHFPNFSPGPPSQAQTTRQSFWETQTVSLLQNMHYDTPHHRADEAPETRVGGQGVS